METELHASAIQATFLYGINTNFKSHSEAAGKLLVMGLLDGQIRIQSLQSIWVSELGD